MIALADVNAFYANCEQVFRPDLAGKAIVVLSNNDGCVIARNAQAKALGIKMGVPFFQLSGLVKQHHVMAFSSNYALYADMSQRVMSILEGFSPNVEEYSIDEAFLDFSGWQAEQIAEQAKKMHHQVFQYTGLKIGVGVGRTKTLAKIANYAAKKYPATGGIVVLSELSREKKLLSLVPVEEVWGVGRQLATHFKQKGIHSALALAQCDPMQIRKSFNVVVERTVRELQGEPCLTINVQPDNKQQIICSRSFGQKITAFEPLKQAIYAYAEQAAVRLRQQKSYCQHVGLFIKTSPFSATEPYYHRTVSAKLLYPTSDTRDILQAIQTLLPQIWQDHHHYNKAGIILGSLSEKIAQYDLFQSAMTPRREHLMATLDALNRKGASIWFAGQGIRAQQSWRMKRQLLSPSYTTNWGEIPPVFIR